MLTGMYINMGVLLCVDLHPPFESPTRVLKYIPMNQTHKT
jgi:hypothetical protein